MGGQGPRLLRVSRGIEIIIQKDLHSEMLYAHVAPPPQAAVKWDAYPPRRPKLGCFSSLVYNRNMSLFFICAASWAVRINRAISSPAICVHTKRVAINKHAVQCGWLAVL